VAETWYHRPSKKEQSASAATKQKNDPKHRSWVEKEELTSHSSQRGDADCAVTPCPRPEAVDVHTERGGARVGTMPEKGLGSRKSVYVVFLAVFHLTCASIIVTGFKIVIWLNGLEFD